MNKILSKLFNVTIHPRMWHFGCGVKFIHSYKYRPGWTNFYIGPIQIEQYIPIER